MRTSLITAALVLELLLTGSFLWSVLFPRKRIWPTAGWRSWRFWCVWILTVGTLAGFFTVSFLDWNSFFFSHWSRYLIGGTIFSVGMLFALWGVVTLSFRTSAGVPGEFVTFGPYRWSRNPQYVGAFGVLLGWAIVSNSRLAFLLAGLGVVCFLLAAFCEEPWLRQRYGERYELYRNRVARFIGWPGRRNADSADEGSLDYEPGVLRVFESKEETRQFYNKIAGVYDRLTDRAEAPLRAAGLQMLAVGPGQHVLEIGFGTGHTLVELAKSAGDAGRVCGIDIAENMLAVAQQRLESQGLSERAELRCVDAARLPYESACFNAVFTSFTLELFDTPEIPIVLGECRRVLRPGGRIVVVSTSKAGRSTFYRRIYEWLHRRLPHLVDSRPIYVRRALEAAGFTVVRCEIKRMWVPVEIVLGVKPCDEPQLP